jgi:predicted acetyltransferase
MQHLNAPSIKYKKSFIAMVIEYQQQPDNNRPDIIQLNPKVLEKDFDSYVQLLNDNEHGKQLPEGYVAQSTFWLVENDEIIGRSSIRHRLNDHLLKIGGHIGYDIRPSMRRRGYGKLILKLTLEKAKEMGIENALITCDINNIGSKKVIESNGGVLENEVDQGKDLPLKARYWIKIK